MKKFSHGININQGNNYFITHTESDWSAGRTGLLISIGDDNHFYTVGKIEDINFITDFTYENNRLVIPGHYEDIFILDDIVTVSYKEYEIFIVKSILNGGNGYSVGDILTYTDSGLSVNVFDNSQQPATFKVESIGPSGEVTSLSLQNKGKYIRQLSSINLKGGRGSDCSIEVLSNVIVNRAMIEKQIESAREIDGNTILEINYILPIGVKEGKISLSKKKVFLTGAYVGNTKRNTHFHINRDYTPNLKLPLLVKNSNKHEENLNHSLLEIDKIISKLLQDIEELKKK